MMSKCKKSFLIGVIISILIFFFGFYIYDQSNCTGLYGGAPADLCPLGWVEYTPYLIILPIVTAILGRLQDIGVIRGSFSKTLEHTDKEENQKHEGEFLIDFKKRKLTWKK